MVHLQWVKEMIDDRPSSNSLETDEILEDATSDVPPSGGGEPSERAVKAWNALCGKMVEVVKTIRKNEKMQAESNKRNSLTHKLIWIAVLAMLGGDYYMGEQRSTERAAELTKLADENKEASTAMTKKQEATLRAVAEIAKAMGKVLDVDTNPQEAAEATVDAQRAALEAKKELTDSFTEKIMADKAIRKLDERK